MDADRYEADAEVEGVGVEQGGGGVGVGGRGRVEVARTVRMGMERLMWGTMGSGMGMSRRSDRVQVPLSGGRTTV